jgi:hypothetical protein
MTPRIFAALTAVVCAGSILGPDATMARSGGMAPGMHAPAPAPAMHPSFGHAASPWMRPGVGPRTGRFNHAIPGYAWPLAAGWFGLPVSEFDGGTGAYPDAPYPRPAPPAPQPSATVSAPSPVVQTTRIIVIRGGCESTPETIRWRDGSARTITMVRC